MADGIRKTEALMYGGTMWSSFKDFLNLSLIVGVPSLVVWAIVEAIGSGS